METLTMYPCIRFQSKHDCTKSFSLFRQNSKIKAHKGNLLFFPWMLWNSCSKNSNAWNKDIFKKIQGLYFRYYYFYLAENFTNYRKINQLSNIKKNNGVENVYFWNLWILLIGKKCSTKKYFFFKSMQERTF